MWNEVEDAPQAPDVGYGTLRRSRVWEEENVVSVSDIGFTHV